ncbi:MAG: alkaline phosphatase D family protein [Flavobacteriales bacterium]|nr:alkaline phosphatase D family protein [Flavobacteriales bacterium]
MAGSFPKWIVYSLLMLTQTLSAQVTLPPDLYADTAHAPFIWGVASGDPLPGSVLIWTRSDPDPTNGGPQVLVWEMATDLDLNDIIASGQVTVSAATDHCARVDVSGLEPSNTYYYRFSSTNGATSAVGRTHTAPAGDNVQVRFAVASCSSIYSGYFNAYKRIAERNDLDLVIHLGDYLYDFVDSNEQVRVPSVFPTGPASEDEWRERHRYYLLDPDLRAARQMHPWAVIWDNHDYVRAPESGIRAFWEYVPRRDPHDDIDKIHRTLRYGDLVDLTLIDVQKFRNIDTIAPNEASVLTNEQRIWFLNELSTSTAKWRIVGNQKMFGGWISEGLPDWLPINNDGGVFDRGSWDGFMAERDTVLRFVEEHQIDNIMVISGDVHMSFAMDLTRNPTDTNIYDPVTGNGSLGVEFIPTSISRGNFDEAGIPPSLATLFETSSFNMNPHHRFVEFVQHGYGILNIEHDSIVAEWWYSPILEPSDNEILAKSMTVEDGRNRWKRLDTATTGLVEKLPDSDDLHIYPNPNNGRIEVRLNGANREQFQISVISMDGRKVLNLGTRQGPLFSADLSSLASGMYVLELQGHGAVYRRILIRN